MCIRDRCWGIGLLFIAPVLLQIQVADVTHPDYSQQASCDISHSPVTYKGPTRVAQVVWPKWEWCIRRTDSPELEEVKSPTTGSTFQQWWAKADRVGTWGPQITLILTNLKDHQKERKVLDWNCSRLHLLEATYIDRLHRQDRWCILCAELDNCDRKARDTLWLNCCKLVEAFSHVVTGIWLNAKFITPSFGVVLTSGNRLVCKAHQLEFLCVDCHVLLPTSYIPCS